MKSSKKAKERRRILRRRIEKNTNKSELDIEYDVWRMWMVEQDIPPEEIDRRIDALVFNSLASKHSTEYALKATGFYQTQDGYVSPDDKKYKPSYVMKELTGQARATGETAKAVKRGKTITKYQYDKSKE